MNVDRSSLASLHKADTPKSAEEQIIAANKYQKSKILKFAYILHKRWKHF